LTKYDARRGGVLAVHVEAGAAEAYVLSLQVLGSGGGYLQLKYAVRIGDGYKPAVGNREYAHAGPGLAIGP
jgi:hypothetical protein